MNTNLPPDAPVQGDDWEGKSDDEDLTPHEYALLNCLAQDHLSDPAALEHILTLQKYLSNDDAFWNDIHLPQLDLGSEYQVEERLTLTQDAAKILQMVSGGITQDEIDIITFPMLSSKDVASMKIELPLLKTDHETDCRKFVRWEGFEIKVQDIKLPLEVVDEAKGEGLSIPESYFQLSGKLMENLTKEKIEVSKEGILFLQSVIKDNLSHVSYDELLIKELKYKRNSALEQVTPHLLPMSPPPEPYQPSPSSSAYQLPLLPDSEFDRIFQRDLEAVERSIFEQDLPTPLRQTAVGAKEKEGGTSSDTLVGDGTMKLADIYSPAASYMDNSTPRKPVERVKLEDLKVEGPLTPSMSISPKHVRFDEIIEEIGLGVFSLPIWPDSAPPNSDEVDTFFRDAFGEAAERATMQIEHESLIAADTTGRVEVRVLPDYKPEPPWKLLRDANCLIKLEGLQKEMMNKFISPSVSPWPGAFRNKEYRWHPFPHNIAKAAVEQLEQEDSGLDHESWKAFVYPEGMDEMIDNSRLCWSPGLKFFHIDKDEDEVVEPAEWHKGEPQNLSYLVKKRKMELEEEREEEQVVQKQARVAQPARHITSLVKVNTPKQTNFISGIKTTQPDFSRQPDSLLGGAFSAGNLLGNYMELHGKKPKVVDSGQFPAKSPLEKLQALPQQIYSTTIADRAQLPIRNSPTPKPPKLPTPKISDPQASSTIIISSPLLKQRALIRHLENLLLNLTLVERDFNAHNVTTWLPGSVTRSPITSSLDSEADFIISPSTGVILTTLQKMKQKPLPGQKTKVAIRDRLEKVSLRYDKLIVLITEGRKDESADGLAESDCLALAEFFGFVAGLPATVIVHFVAGGEETLAKWLASIVMQYRPVKEIKLLSEETYWELFLRRAGMNTFAAQAVIAELRAPRGVDRLGATKTETFGLSTFVEMAAEQRSVQFGDLVGRRIVERVSVAIDGRWG
ncbi:hypothetical protein BGZ60DRAFT_525397 [Tricladium varicosporioides]|nr:hypothetical protein BGZ60DRAFT_525397 [Hymenoscyphus varicosporioides]